MGVSRVGQEGANALSWNLKMMTSYVVLLYNALNFSLAPSALVLLATKFSLNFPKTAKNREIFNFYALRAQKSTIFPFLLAINAGNFVLRTENLQKVSIFFFGFWLKIVPLLGKFPGDAHGRHGVLQTICSDQSS